MPELARFQDAFDAALAGDETGLAPWLDGPADGLSVYRNTVRKGLIDAVLAAFPAVERLVGSEWLRAAAGLYVRDHPPRAASLSLYGENFPDWLAAFEPAGDMPYLPGVARLDHFWLEAHLAADAPVLDAQAFAGLSAEDLERVCAVPHPSVRSAWFDANIPSLWLANRPEAEPVEGFELTDKGEAALIARPGLEVRARVLDRPAHAFLAACRRGESLARAAEAAAEADLAALLSVCFAEGLFTALRPIGGTDR